MKQFWMVFGLIILFMTVWAVILGGVLIGFDIQDDDEAGFYIVFPAIFVIFATFLPYLNIASGWAFRFKGEGTPIPEEELRKKIFAINSYDVPVMVKEKRKKIIVTWKYVDAKWYDIIAKSRLRSMYELHIKFKAKKYLVTLIDIEKTIQWRVGPESIRLKGGFFRGVMLHWEISKLWGFDENFKFRKIYDYRFVPTEIKNPVLNEILRSGWNVRFRMW